MPLPVLHVFVEIVFEHVEGRDVHCEKPWNDFFPARIKRAELVQNPELQSNGQIDIILEMPNDITRADIVNSVQVIIPHDELIAQGTRDSDIADVARVLRIPDREIRLAAERMLLQMKHQIVQISETVANSLRYSAGILERVRPDAFHIRMREASFLIAEAVCRIAPWPVSPLHSGVDAFSSDTLLEMIIGPRKIR